MKKILFAMTVLFAAQAFAAVGWVRPNPPAIRWFGKPEYVDLYDIRHWSPTDAQCVEAGWVACEYGGNPADAVLDYSATPPLRDMTQEELDARDAAQAAAQAEAEAHANDPVRFDNGIVSGNGFVYIPATPGGSNGWVVAVTTNGDLLTSHWYGSPTSTVSEIVSDLTNRAARLQTKKNAAKAAKAKGNGTPALQARIAALEALLGVE